jgi:DNA-binding transcriptional MerR regulator
MYKIGEFSKITGLSIKALRYYDKEGILVPADRESDNAYRLYDAHNYKNALLIKRLRQLNFSISEIKDTLSLCVDEDDLHFILTEKKQLIQKEIEEKKELIEKINASVNTIIKEELLMNYEVKVEQIPSVQIASIRYVGKYEDCGKYAGKIFRSVKGKASGDFFNLYHELEYSEQADIEVCVPIKSAMSTSDINCRTLAEMKAITTIHKGRYENIGNAYKALFDYAKNNDYEVKTPIRDEYIKGPGMIFEGNPNKYITKIILPIKIDEGDDS